MKIGQVEADLFHVDRRTENLYDAHFTFHSFANAPQKPSGSL